eukprot:14492592-Alexandrium_andersonii.AAC.1
MFFAESAVNEFTLFQVAAVVFQFARMFLCGRWSSTRTHDSYSAGRLFRLCLACGLMGDACVFMCSALGWCVPNAAFCGFAIRFPATSGVLPFRPPPRLRAQVRWGTVCSMR